MRMINLFLGRATRNDPVRLEDPRPIPRYADSVTSGDAGLDGYTILSRADPARQGESPPVQGQLGLSYMGPASDWEQ